MHYRKFAQQMILMLKNAIKLWFLCLRYLCFLSYLCSMLMIVLVPLKSELLGTYNHADQSCWCTYFSSYYFLEQTVHMNNIVTKQQKLFLIFFLTIYLIIAWKLKYWCIIIIISYLIRELDVTKIALKLHNLQCFEIKAVKQTLQIYQFFFKFFVEKIDAEASFSLGIKKAQRMKGRST